MSTAQRASASQTVASGPADEAAALRVFDALAPVAAMTPVDLANHGRFDTERIVAAVPAARRSDGADLLRAMRRLSTDTIPATRAMGIVASAALGVTPANVPERAFDEVWTEMRRMLSGSNITAVGPLTLDRGDRFEVDLMMRQMEMAADSGLPVIVAPGGADAAARFWELLRLVTRLGVSQHVAIVVDHAARLDAALDTGAHIILVVGASGIRAGRAAALVASLPAHSLSRIMLASGTGGVDVLAVHRVGLHLRRAGLDAEVVASLLYGCASSFHDQPRRRWRLPDRRRSARVREAGAGEAVSH